MSTVRTTTESSAPRSRAAKRRPAAKSTAPAPLQGAASSKPEPELVVEWFRLLARCRGAWLQHSWSANGVFSDRNATAHTDFVSILSDHDSLHAEHRWARDHDAVQRWKANAEKLASEMKAVVGSRFAQVARVFNLSSIEVDLLRLCAAVAFDPTLARACAYLHDDSRKAYVTEELASRLLGIDRATVWAPEMNVFRWELIERHATNIGEGRALTCDPQVRDWLRGTVTLDENLVGSATVLEPRHLNLPEWRVEELAAWIDESLQKPERQRLRIVVIAPSGGGKRSFAAAVTDKLRMPLLLLDPENVDESNWERWFMRAQRQAFLDGAALAWTTNSAQRGWPSGYGLFPLQFILVEPGSDLREISGATDRIVHLAIPDSRTRELLWRQSSPEAERWDARELRRLAERHRVWPGDIERAGRLGASSPPTAEKIVRERARARFGNLIQTLDTPFTPDDLVLPKGVKQLLEALTFEAEDRPAFWQQSEAARLFPQGRGLIALFSGASGTGKTMAAQVIAGRLGQDLCRINVAQLVSKWVGETPKNVEQVVRVAAENDVLLFFDEADALFAKRSSEVRDAQDKFANTDTAFLLQAVESYPGIAILATNLKSNIDKAFLRRLRYIVEFPKPDPTLQLILWTKLISALTGEECAKSLKPVLEILSETTETTGAQIKFAVLAALFAARAERVQLQPRHLLTGFDRELAKEGRALGPKERERILRTGGER